jgi:RNA recognition motif-containing protein
MNILISNLGSSVTNESLHATFATYGQVRSATIMADGSQGVTGVTAIIEMPDEREARAAITRLHGAILDGSIIAVKEVVQIQPRSFSFLRGSIFNKK